MELKIREATKQDYDAINSVMTETYSIHVEYRKDLYTEIEDPLDKAYYEDLLDDKRAKVFLVEWEKRKETIAYIILHVKETPKRNIFVPRKLV